MGESAGHPREDDGELVASLARQVVVGGIRPEERATRDPQGQIGEVRLDVCRGALRPGGDLTADGRGHDSGETVNVVATEDRRDTLAAPTPLFAVRKKGRLAEGVAHDVAHEPGRPYDEASATRTSRAASGSCTRRSGTPGPARRTGSPVAARRSMATSQSPRRPNQRDRIEPRKGHVTYHTNV